MKRRTILRTLLGLAVFLGGAAGVSAQTNVGATPEPGFEPKLVQPAASDANLAREKAEYQQRLEMQRQYNERQQNGGMVKGQSQAQPSAARTQRDPAQGLADMTVEQLKAEATNCQVALDQYAGRTAATAADREALALATTYFAERFKLARQYLATKQ
jgi:hypothetical protein